MGAGFDTEFETDPNIAYYVIASVGEGACEECKKLDGFHFLRSKLRDYRVPIPTCKHLTCFCQIFAVYRDEEGAADIAAFLERSGGVATAAQIEARKKPSQKR